MTEPAGEPQLTDRAFARFQALIHREAGIALAEGKRALLFGRLARRVRELGLPSFDAYYEHVTAGGGDELVRMLDAVCTNETQFFREPRQLELLGGPVCDRWIAEAAAGRRSRRVRVWSAACSTGEEPYSIAMLLHERLAPLGWTIEILASDLSTRVLAQAERAVWKLDKATGIPERLRRAYLLRGVDGQDGNVKIDPTLRRLVTFERINLRAPLRPTLGTFDAVFCRNVLIYFDGPTREATVAALLRHTAPGGLLFLGHAESLLGGRRNLEPVMPAVYRVPAGAAA